MRRSLFALFLLMFAGTCGAADIVAFRAHKNFIAQTGFVLNQHPEWGWVDNYNLVSWHGLAFGVRFADNAWMPVLPGEPPAIVVFQGQVWVSEHATGNPPVYVAKIIKNGYPGQDISAGLGSPGGFVNSWVVTIGTADFANPGDTYRLYLYVTNSDAIVDGHPAHTWWSGVRQ